MFLAGVSIKIFDNFFLIRLFVSLLLNFRSSLYILQNNPLSEMSFINIFSKSVTYLLIVLSVFPGDFCIFFIELSIQILSPF